MLDHSMAKEKHWVAQTSLEQCLRLGTDSSLWWRNHPWRANIRKEMVATAMSAISHRWHFHDVTSLAHVLPSWLGTKRPVLNAHLLPLGWAAVPCPAAARRAATLRGLELWLPLGRLVQANPALQTGGCEETAAPDFLHSFCMWEEDARLEVLTSVLIVFHPHHG